ncbi:hypothetical protein GOP47_0019278 [Adiantum capillus-veneris]|uniref:Glutaredoxin domain-containing protein n=1 Tax=Adiantum capillus-veneris TaxID=13818 RepID=A0A9D4Z9H4_ADICA|nr:hypothetical protein GOP47_0019278 [Adiantum capillus-veneris]
MGCVSSKHLKKQALLEEKWGITSPGRRKPFEKAPPNELSFEEYHRHLVALTSSSYGLLKVDTPKPSEEVKRSTVRVRSLDDLYDRLDILESMESAPTSTWEELKTVLQTSKHAGHQRSISIPIPHSSKSAVQETINVSDIMQGLEEEASASSPSSLDVGSMAPSINKALGHLPPSAEPERLNIRHKKYDKLPSFHNTREGLAKLNSGTVVHETSLRASRDHQPSLSSTVPSEVSYSTSSRRLKLTLNLEYENTLMTGMQMSQDASTSVSSSARRSIVDALTEPDSPLFDPALLASYEKALQELRKEDWSIANDTNDFFEKMRLSKETQMDVGAVPSLHVPEHQSNLREPFEEAISASLTTESVDPLNEFEWRCPPGGEETIVLYTTTLHGIRKTFEDCNNVRDILKGFSVGFNERDVSMHLAYRNELRELLGVQLSVPSVFIKGRYIGGVDDAIKLHEEGKLAVLLKGLPKDLNIGMCDGCGNMRFVPCLVCCGSCKVVDQDNSLSRCSECNENGLIPCPICS